MRLRRAAARRALATRGAANLAASLHQPREASRDCGKRSQKVRSSAELCDRDADYERSCRDRQPKASVGDEPQRPPWCEHKRCLNEDEYTVRDCEAD